MTSLDASRSVSRYLSPGWIEDVAATASASAELQGLAGRRRLAVTEVVTGGPDGDVTYHVVVGDGAVRVATGPADGEDVRFVQDWATAVAIVTGEANAQEAFLKGAITLTGDHEALLGNQDVLMALEAVFADVRLRTLHA